MRKGEGEGELTNVEGDGDASTPKSETPPPALFSSQSYSATGVPAYRLHYALPLPLRFSTYV
jgi:hypothetical protein